MFSKLEMAASCSTAASTSTSLNPNNSTNSAFDVFINHRGPDVKNSFASYLYRRLTSYGFEVFLDRDELRQGEYFNSQIEEAIRTASVHIAIFSPRYADSPWCLNELLMMLESRAKIIPVFYQVKPADLRWTQGTDTVYARSLKKLGEKTEYEAQTERNVLICDPQSPQKKLKLRHNADIIEQWRNALLKVADISGFELEACNGDEGLLLDKVVECVSINVIKPLDVAKYPTGLEEKVRDFENRVLVQHPQRGRKVQVVGIVGLGGVGKTTLAKEIFNRKRKNSQSFNKESSGYARSCFLNDVRETVVKGSLIILQRKLLRSLTGSDQQIENKDEGIPMLKKHLSSHKILLVLDDVDSVDQIDQLVPDPTCIHSDSFILITSRDKGVLTRSGVENSLIYELRGLSRERSLKLFCQHAFRQPDPLPGFENVAQLFVKACDGLPLSLKVFGGLLHGNNDLSYWSAQLVQLRNRLHEDIKGRLQISYEALNEEEKQVFLDIGCFFIGEEREMAISIWNVSKWGGSLALQNLQNKCLVEVDSSNLIRMHDHLRDLAISEASVKQPFRFCHFDDLLKQSTGILTVRGIKMVRKVLPEWHDDDNDDDDDDAAAAAAEMNDNDDDDDDYDYIPMKRDDDDDNFNFDSIQMNNNDDHHDDDDYDFDSIFHYIMNDNDDHHYDFDSIFHSIQMNDNDDHDDDYDFDSITMKRLHIVDTEGSLLERILKSAKSPNLIWLRWNKCPYSALPRDLIPMNKLKFLRVSGQKLETLWQQESQLPLCLEELDVNGCENLKNIWGLEHLTKLQWLDVSLCSQLEELSAKGCTQLKRIRGLTHARRLQRLDVSGCAQLDELRLDGSGCAQLEELSAKGCTQLKRIRGLDDAKQLQRLDVSGCAQLDVLSVGWSSQLEELSAKGCTQLKRIWGLEHARQLQRLDVSGCAQLDELSIQQLSSLEYLSAEGCTQLKRMGLEHACGLQRLDVSGCYQLEELSAKGCLQLKRIRGLEHLTKLQRLDVSGCYQLEELSAKGCLQLKRIRGLEHLTKLQKLDVYGCFQLEELSAKGCTQLKRICCLGGARQLQRLDVSGCAQLDELNMGLGFRLEELSAKGCTQLKRIRGLECATQLQRVDVSGCAQLDELCMERCFQLEELSAKGCTQLKRIRVWSAPHNFRV